MGTGEDEVKHENAHPEAVSATAGCDSLVFLAVDILQNGDHGSGQRLDVQTLVIGFMGGIGLFRLDITLF